MNHRNGGVELVITGPWTSQTRETVESGKVDRLVLNYALGFEGTSLEFLDGLPLRELVILAPQVSDLQPIYSLAPTLRKLQITTDPRLALDLVQLPGLEEIAAAWSQVSQTIAAAQTLRVAFLRSYASKDLSPLASLTELEVLVMKDRPKLASLQGLRELHKLKSIGIYLAKGLADISDLTGQSNLDELALEHCRRFTHIDSLRGCSSLRRLNLSDCDVLESLDPIRGLVQLEQVMLYGSTKIADDDLSPLIALPRLRELRMQSRRSYRPTVEEVQAHMQLRN